MQAASRGWRAPHECTPVTLRFESRMVWIDSKATYDCVAVLVSETLSCIVREYAVTLTVGMSSLGMSNETGTRFLSVRLIVYGLLQQKDAIAHVLAEGGLLLQHPGQWEFDQSVSYNNPQYLLGPGQKMLPLEELSIATCCVTREPHSAQVRGLFDEDEIGQVQRIFDTSSMSFGFIKKKVRCSILFFLMKNQLHLKCNNSPKRHQNEALMVMIEKEEGTCVKARFPTVWEAFTNSNDTVVYQNIITELFNSAHPPPPGGGILADEMGLGKTLSSLSLICHYLDQLDQSPDFCQRLPRTALIVTPKSSIFISRFRLSSSLCYTTIYQTVHSQQETARTLGQSDVVLTTYDTLRPEGIRKGPLFENEWARVILDEAHRIRNRSSKTFTTVCGLRSRRRWCLTETPIQNCLDDLGALLELTKTPSLHTDNLIARPMPENKKKIALLCSKSNHSAELDLPRKLEKIEYVSMGRDDRELYEFFNRFSFSNTKSILVLISMLRLICDYGEVLLTERALKAWRERDEKLLSWGILEANVTHESTSQGRSRNQTRQRYPPSAKVEAVLHNISLRQEWMGSDKQPCKAVISSYWTKMLDLIGSAFGERGLPFQRIDEQSSLPQRKASIQGLSNGSQCNILLASIGPAGEGIDLTSANPVVDGVHRIGQKQDVEVVRHIVQDLIELVSPCIVANGLYSLQVIQISLIVRKEYGDGVGCAVEGESCSP
ncbi:SNF2 family N-terminal domain-containing protein [Aspergillus karnatakaensis]|uniref:DEAD/DEAH box helicase n=1 Tax=Aspergillus karnatakaensis TaxID=1810916 RepID=UPI003CCE173B